MLFVVANVVGSRVIVVNFFVLVASVVAGVFVSFSVVVAVVVMCFHQFRSYCQWCCRLLQPSVICLVVLSLLSY